MEQSKQHVQLPVEENSELDPRDKLIYVCIRRFADKDLTCFPSLAEISRLSGATVNTVRKIIQKLIDLDYISRFKKGRHYFYKFNELKSFEPFSYEFLDKEDLTFQEKAYIIAAQQYMFKDEVGIGKICYTNSDLARKINSSGPTVGRLNKSLIKKGYLGLVETRAVDKATGEQVIEKIYNLNALGQAVIWTLRDHEERLQDVEDKVDSVQKTNELLLKQNNELLNEINRLKKELGLRPKPVQTEYEPFDYDRRRNMLG